MSIIDGHRSTRSLVTMWLSDVASGYLAKWAHSEVAGNSGAFRLQPPRPSKHETQDPGGAGRGPRQVL